MSNIVAGIGRGQLKVIDLRIKQKTDIYNRYKEAFKQIPDIEMQPTPVDTVPNHWLSVITLKANSKVKPLDIMEALEKENIETSIRRLIYKRSMLAIWYKNDRRRTKQSY